MSRHTHIFRPLLAAGATFALALLACGLLIQHVDKIYVQDQRYTALQAALAVRTRLEGGLESNLSILHGMRAELSVNPHITQERFEQVAAQLLQGDHQLSHIALAPDLVIRMIYPLPGNEQAIGLDYRQQPERMAGVRQAIELRETVLSGPMPLVQGGIELIAREPVFTAGARAELWGIVVGVIDVDELLARAGVPALQRDYALALRGVNGRGVSGAVFHGPVSLFSEDAQTTQVTIPGGQWQLAIRPLAGWHLSLFKDLLFLGVSMLASAILAAIVLISQLSRLERERHRAEMEERASIDYLTNLPNRYHIHRHLDGLIESVRQARGKFALMFLDLDSFKEVNDSLGHGQGDRLLVEAADRMRAAVGPLDIVGRFGGDEFLVLMPQVGSVEAAEGAADRLLQQFQRPFGLGDREVSISASAGVVLFPLDGGDSTTLLQHADRAMYAAKRAGRATWSFFDFDLRRQADHYVRLTGWMRRGIGEGEFRVHYQPVHRIPDGRVIKCEALLRWRHPEYGDIPPGEFVPVAERSGMIRELGLLVLTQVCADMQRLRAAGLELQVSINRSLAEFASEETVAQWLSIVQSHGIAPESIIFEITESLLAREYPLVERSIIKVREQGFQLALDDFGTGYSAIDYLRRLPVEFIKIDKSFVQDAEHSEQGRTLLKILVELAGALKMQVIAEGIETLVQLEYLKSLGVEFAQGYYFAGALTFDEMRQYLIDHPHLPRVAALGQAGREA